MISKLRGLRSPEVSMRCSSSIIFSCIASFSSRFGALLIGFPVIFSLSWSLVFSPSKTRSSYPQISLKSSLCSLGTVPGSFSIACVSDVTIQPILRTWAPIRLCLLTPSGWIPPPSPCAVDSGYHIGWHH